MRFRRSLLWLHSRAMVGFPHKRLVLSFPLFLPWTQIPQPFSSFSWEKGNQQDWVWTPIRKYSQEQCSNCSPLYAGCGCPGWLQLIWAISLLLYHLSPHCKLRSWGMFLGANRGSHQEARVSAKCCWPSPSQHGDHTALICTSWWRKFGSLKMIKVWKTETAKSTHLSNQSIILSWF